MDAQEGAIRRRQALADSMIRQGMTPDQNMTHPMSVIGKVGQSLAGALLSYKAGQQEDQYREGINQRMADILSGGGAQAPAPMPSAPADPLTSAVSGVDMPPPPQNPTPAPRNPAPVSGPYGPIIQAAAQRNGLPATLLAAQIQQESGGRPDAVGRAGEIGLGQIMPSTARQPGFGVKPVDPARLTDPAVNINFQADYLAARGRAAGVRDWNDPQQQAVGLRNYNGGGDPNYVQNVTRHLPQAAGAAQAPMLQQPPAAPAGGGGVDYLAAARRAMIDPAPQIRAMAPVLAQMANAQATSGQRDARLQFDMGKDARDHAWRQQEAAQRRGESDRDYRLRIELANRDERLRRELHDPRMETVRGPEGQPTLVPAKQAPGQTAYIPSQEPLTPERAAQNIAARPQTTINTAQETAFEKGVGTRLAEGVTERQQAAQAGREAMEASDRIMALLPGANTGTGAQWRTNFERALATAGLIDGRTVSNTEQLMANMARSLLPMAANMKGSLSDKDLAFLQQANGMSVTATPETIKRMADLQRQLGQRAIEAWNPVAETLQRGGGARDAAAVLMPTIQPPVPAAQGMPAGPPPDATAAPPISHRFNPATGRIEPYGAR